MLQITLESRVMHIKRENQDRRKQLRLAKQEVEYKMPPEESENRKGNNFISFKSCL